ncbi:polyphenol oxidase, chloroplastic [Iris pallida]|uniref:Polyphenol oxidase, chloroplastic n=1 Tax=Iris pallida TaxID=29817 RepID=A0AAX6DQM4_IRIPA|nr:polyphenol oxidase, chloroplastic [Iris pallida]
MWRGTRYLAKYNKLSIMKRLPPDPPQLAPPVPNTLHTTARRLQSSRRRRRRPFHDPRELALLPVPPFYVYFHERILGSSSATTPSRSRTGTTTPHGCRSRTSTRGTTERREAECPPLAARACSHRHHSRESRRGLRRTRRRRADRHQPGPAVPAHGLGRVQAGALHGLQAPARGRRGVLRDGDDRNGAPHSLHLWVGNTDLPEYEDMGTIYAAARDPSSTRTTPHRQAVGAWRLLHGYRGSRPEFDDPLWLDSHFYFYDENADLVRVRFATRSTDRLGYAYEEVDLPWLDARPKPSVAPELARSLLRAKEKDYDNMLRMATTRVLDSGRDVRFQVARPVPKSTIKAGQEEFEEEVLVVEGSCREGNARQVRHLRQPRSGRDCSQPQVARIRGVLREDERADVAMKGGSIRNMRLGYRRFWKTWRQRRREHLGVTGAERLGPEMRQESTESVSSTCNDSSSSST